MTDDKMHLKRKVGTAQEYSSNLTGAYHDIKLQLPLGPKIRVVIATSSYSRKTARTFSAKEMAFNLLELVHPLLFGITEVEPICAGLNGGMGRLPDLADIIRSELHKKADLRRVVAHDNAADHKIVCGVEAGRLLQTVDVLPRANFRFDFPGLEPAILQDLSHLRGPIDLVAYPLGDGNAW